MGEDIPDAARTKASLRRLAGPEPGTIVDRAADATADIEAASRFVESSGLDRLAAAVAATDDPAVEARGRRALEAFRRFGRAAAGEGPQMGAAADHFHRGHGIDLSRAGEGPDQ